MKIFAIDSTSAKARVGVINGFMSFFEKWCPWYTEKWIQMRNGDTSVLVDDFLKLVDDFLSDSWLEWEQIDYICYSGYSGFQISMNVGKILATILWKIYNIEVINVDHITAHYFSLFTQEYNKKWSEFPQHNFPILFFSASWSHNSLAVMKSWKDLTILNDNTYYDDYTDKYIGMGSIYYKMLKATGILKDSDFPSEIDKKLSSIKREIDSQVVEKCMELYGDVKVFDTDFYDLYKSFLEFYIEDNHMHKIKNTVLFFSFEEAMFKILARKFDEILILMDIKEIAIVWWISMNDSFINFLESRYSPAGLKVSRPNVNYRLDNASMLGTLAYAMKKFEVEYPFSRIVT